MIDNRTVREIMIVTVTVTTVSRSKLQMRAVYSITKVLKAPFSETRTFSVGFSYFLINFIILFPTVFSLKYHIAIFGISGFFL